MRTRVRPRTELVALAALASCAHAGVGSPAPVRPVDADIVAKSHALLDAFDRGERAVIEPQLAEEFVHFEGSASDRAKTLEELAKWKASDSHVATRTWSAEHVYATPTSAVFVGTATERQSGNDSHAGGYQFEGTYTLAWTRAGSDWRLAYWGWQVAGSIAQSATWNQIYVHGTGFEHRPNRLLVDAVSAPGVTVGTAMDVAMGQGRNGLYLAAHGWRVTGVDISDEGVKQARASAEAAHVKLDALVTDVATYDYGIERWDLVAMIYAPSAISRIGDLAKSVKRGGVFVYEYFAPESPADEGAPQPGALAKQFAGWTILRDDITRSRPDWAQDEAPIQRFVARRSP